MEGLADVPARYRIERLGVDVVVGLVAGTKLLYLVVQPKPPEEVVRLRQHARVAPVERPGGRGGVQPRAGGGDEHPGRQAGEAGDAGDREHPLALDVQLALVVAWAVPGGGA